MSGGPIEAVLFDMDGTLVDSEPMTRTVVDAVLAEVGRPPASIPDERLHGVTWAAIAADLRATDPQIRCSAGDLSARWMALWRGAPPAPVPGASEALDAARAAGLRTALATSSDPDAAEALVARPAFAGRFDALVTAADIARSKPDPEIFLRAAERLGVAPDRCLIFEDSLAGLRAAGAAGMARVAILLRCADPAEARRLADAAVPHFEALPPGFFGRLGGGLGAALRGPQ